MTTPTPPGTRTRPLVVVILVALLLAATAAGAWLYTRWLVPASQFSGIDVTGQRAPEFDLKDTAGKSRTLSDFTGKPLVVFFGFLNCPDACPTFLAKMREVRTKIGPDHKFNVALITVDPERDKAEVLRAFLDAFDASFVGLIPSRAQLPSLLAQFKAFAQSNPPNASGYYAVDHTTYAFVFDSNGALRLIMPHDLAAADWASDLSKLIHAKGRGDA